MKPALYLSRLDQWLKIPALQEANMHKIIVCLKRVVDFNVRIQVKPDGSGVVTDGVKLSANPFDDIALEEALRLREKGIATDVVVACIGPADAQAHMRNGLAMGANRAIHVVTGDAIQPLTAARALLKLIEREQPDIVLLGKQAIDDDCNQTGQMLAALWDRPQATLPRRSRSVAASPRSRAKWMPASKPSKSTCLPSSPPTCASTSRASSSCRTS
jgi:hypothetical protein